VLIGAGLPRTGTKSTRAALKQLLGGDIYHMTTLIEEREDHRPIWRKIMAGKGTEEDLKSLLRDFRGGVDYPVSFYYKEIMEVFPNGKVLLTVRDPVKWYESVRNSIQKLIKAMTSFPASWVAFLIGKQDIVELVKEMADSIPSCSTMGLGMFSAVENGQETALKFWEEHVNEVKNHVPPDKLLIWEVKEGWGPLCKFLYVPQPSTPFPRMNDTAEVLAGLRNLKIISWMVIVGLPMLLAAL